MVDGVATNVESTWWNSLVNQ